MNPRILNTLNELERANWFSKVGAKDSDTVIFVPNWDRAVSLCGSIEWENLCLEAVNQYCERLREKNRHCLERWNEIVHKLKQVTIPMVRGKIATVVSDHGLPKQFEDTVQWDILHICMEAEFADVFPPGFYASQAYWYVSGHFPCGWEGSFPQGKLVVY